MDDPQVGPRLRGRARGSWRCAGGPDPGPTGHAITSPSDPRSSRARDGRSGARGRRSPVILPLGQQGPDDPRRPVRLRHHGHVDRPALQQPADPARARVRAGAHHPHHRSRPVGQPAAEVRVAPLADPAQPFLAAAGVLLGHETQVGGEMATGTEPADVADRQGAGARLEALERQPATGRDAMLRLLARVVGVGVETADMLVHEILSRGLRDRRAVARYAGLTGSPDESGSRRREKGLARSGNARVRRGMIQLAWRFLLHQKDSALARWYRARTADARAGTRKTLIVALARKLLVGLWQLATTGKVPEGLALRPA